MMSQSRGAVSFEPLFTAEDIGLRKEANVEHVMKVFITLGEGVASRWIEMPKGVLLLQTVPDNPASGAIYLYDRELQVFYFVVFDEGRKARGTPPHRPRCPVLVFGRASASPGGPRPRAGNAAPGTAARDPEHTSGRCS